MGVKNVKTQTSRRTSRTIFDAFWALLTGSVRRVAERAAEPIAIALGLGLRRDSGQLYLFH